MYPTVQRACIVDNVGRAASIVVIIIIIIIDFITIVDFSSSIACHGPHFARTQPPATRIGRHHYHSPRRLSCFLHYCLLSCAAQDEDD
jgi:hypothetical protein